MYLVASFEYSDNLELAIAKIKEIGVTANNIFAIPLDLRDGTKEIIDTLDRSDHASYLDVVAVLGTTGMLLGSIYGFVLEWGPIIWGLLGLVIGSCTGLLFGLLRTKNKNRSIEAKKTEVFLLIKCTRQELQNIKNILWNHSALGVADFEKQTI